MTLGDYGLRNSILQGNCRRTNDAFVLVSFPAVMSLPFLPFLDSTLSGTVHATISCPSAFPSLKTDIFTCFHTLYSLRDHGSASRAMWLNVASASFHFILFFHTFFPSINPIDVAQTTFYFLCSFLFFPRTWKSRCCTLTPPDTFLKPSGIICISLKNIK